MDIVKLLRESSKLAKFDSGSLTSAYRNMIEALCDDLEVADFYQAPDSEKAWAVLSAIMLEYIEPEYSPDDDNEDEEDDFYNDEDEDEDEDSDDFDITDAFNDE